MCQCEGLKGELAELQQLYDSSQRERAALEQELQRCKAELHKLVGKKSQVRGQLSKPRGSGALVCCVRMYPDVFQSNAEAF